MKSIVTPVRFSPPGVVSPGFVNLHKMFDLPPGTYKIYATCQLTSPDDPKRLVSILSNQITVSILGFTR
jgi:hypothetical protein